jgi:hypothetical protein
MTRWGLGGHTGSLLRHHPMRAVRCNTQWISLTLEGALPDGADEAIVCSEVGRYFTYVGP